MAPKTETLFSAALGELVTRCISFLINKYLMTTGQSKEEILQQLERALLRVAITVEEAEGRFITSQGMLRQLSLMREDMYKGYYMLDKFRYLGPDDWKEKDHNGSQSLTPSVTIPGKLTPFSGSSIHGKKELKQMLDCIQSVVSDMREFLAFLRNYPPMFREPYSMELLLEKCMFFRHKEMEQTIRFLLHRGSTSEHDLGILPIIGQGKVGKSTFVEHVCCEERVRDHFSQIILFSGNKIIEDEEVRTLKDGGIIKHNNSYQNERKMLVVIELDEDVNGGSWKRLFSVSQSCLPGGSKIIITSRSEKIKDFGTTYALRLDFLPREACWYFFKVLVFGSTYPEDQPKMASIAMEIFEEYYSHNEAFSDFTGSCWDSLRKNPHTQERRRTYIMK